MNENIILQANVHELNGKKAIEIAKKKGINVDNPSLAFFSSVLCEIEKPNANKIRLAEDAVKEVVDTLIGCQVNFNHVGKGAICGFIFDSFINKEKQVVISCVFFKKIYSLEYEHAKKLFSKGELTMSYELTADVESQEKLEDGTRRIHDFYFTGVGLLLGEEPACKNAIVYEFAKKMEDQRQDLIFASQRNLNNVSKNKQKEIDSILASLISQLNIDDKTSEYQDKGGITIVTIEEIKAKLSEELGELVKDWTDADFQNEEKIAEARKIKTEKATTTEVVTTETTAEVKEEIAEKTMVESTEVVTTKTTLDDEKKTETRESEYIVEIKRDGQVVQTQKSTSEVVYMYAQVEAIKADYENQIKALKETLQTKDSEIAEIRANAEKIATLKNEYASNEFTKEFTDADWLNATKIEEAKQLQARKNKIQANKEALKDNEFAKDFTDEDYANDEKVSNVKLQAELKIKEVKIQELEKQIVADTKKETEVASVEKKADLETNHVEDKVATKEPKSNALVSILKEKNKK